MGTVFNQSSRTTIISYLGVVIGYFNVLWLFPAILSAEQIGLIRLLPSIAFMLLPFTQLGLSQSVLKFYPEFVKKPNGSNELLSFMILANFIGFGITLVFLRIFEGEIIHFFEDKSDLANQYFYVATILILLLSFHTIFESFSRSILKIVFPGIIKDVILRLMYTLVILLFYFKIIPFEQVVNGLIVIYSLALFLLIRYVTKRIQLKFSLRFKVIGRSEISSISKYAVYTLLGASGSYIMLNIDQVMISNLIGLSANGIYTTAFYIAIVIEMPRRAIANISTPLISKLFSENKLAEINKLYKQVSINQMLVGSLLLLGILVNLKSLFSLIPNNETYLAGMDVVYIIGLAKLLDMSFGMNSEIILMSKYYRYNILFTTILAVVAIIANWFLIQSYGVEGAAMATGITLVVFNMLKLVFVKVKMGLWPFSFKNIFLVLITASTYYVVQLIPSFDNIWFDMIIRSGITTLIFLVPCLLFKISPEINDFVNRNTPINV